MWPIDPTPALQADDLVCGDAMDIDQSPSQSKRKHLSELHLITPIASPISRKESKRHVRFVLPTSDVKDVVNINLRNIFDDVDNMMMIDEENWGVAEPSSDDISLPDVYWDRNDMKKNRSYAKRKAIIIRSKYPQEVEALENVIVECCNKENMVNQHRIPPERHLFTIIPTEVTTMHNWSSSYVRGLEDYMTPILSEKRFKAIQGIIRYQTFLQEQQYSDIPQRLCEYSRQMSQPSRDFALKLAIGDALAATCDP